MNGQVLYSDPYSDWIYHTRTPRHLPLVQGYNGFNDPAWMWEEPFYGTGRHPPHRQIGSPRIAHQLLQLRVQEEASMMKSQSTLQPSMWPTAPVPMMPASVVPVSAKLRRPRKILTDRDCKDIYLYHIQNTTVKQADIAAKFGLERSTISKVLRKTRMMHLSQDRGSIENSKDKFLDFEPALANWARNHQRQGLPLRDTIDQNKARLFVQTVDNPDGHLDININSNSWLEKSQQNNGLIGARSTVGSIAEESGETPGLPLHVHGNGLSTDPSPFPPSQEEAARALELVMMFFTSQKAEFGLQQQDYATIGELKRKLLANVTV